MGLGKQSRVQGPGQPHSVPSSHSHTLSSAGMVEGVTRTEADARTSPFPPQTVQCCLIQLYLYGRILTVRLAQQLILGQFSLWSHLVRAVSS